MSDYSFKCLFCLTWCGSWSARAWHLVQYHGWSRWRNVPTPEINTTLDYTTLSHDCPRTPIVTPEEHHEG